MGSPVQQVEHEGLQSCQHDSYAPEVVVPQTKAERRTSHDLPEAVPVQHDTGKSVDAYYADHPEQYEGHYSIPPKYEHHEDLQAQLALDKRRKRRRLLIWVGVAILAVIIIIGAVVGGVVGSAAAKKNVTPTPTTSAVASTNSTTSSTSSTPSPPESLKVLSAGGMAITTVNGGQQRYAYAQQKSGAVIEIPYINGEWAFDKQQVVTTNANAGSSIAATTYSRNGADYRVLAFIQSDGRVLVTTAGNDNVWSQETSILTGDSASTQSIALAICADTDTLNGIRVYYASSKLQFIREVGYDLLDKNAKWTMYTNFTDAAANAGVACSISNGFNHLYYRNGTQIQQWVWNYANVDNIWHKGGTSAGAYAAAEHSDIAVTTDGTGTDYIFYRLGSNSSVVRSTFSGFNNVFNGYSVYLTTGQLSEFAAAYVGSGNTGKSLLEYAPVNGGGLTYALTDAYGVTNSTGLLANWT